MDFLCRYPYPGESTIVVIGYVRPHEKDTNNRHDDHELYECESAGCPMICIHGFWVFIEELLYVLDCMVFSHQIKYFSPCETVSKKTGQKTKLKFAFSIFSIYFSRS